jgi:hypothetical protein
VHLAVHVTVFAAIGGGAFILIISGGGRMARIMLLVDARWCAQFHLEVRLAMDDARARVELTRRLFRDPSALPALIDLLPDPRAVLVLRTLVAAYVDYHHRLIWRPRDARASDPERPEPNPRPPGAASE